ncbi:MAG: hypothetical protein ACP5CD_02580 [Thermovirgaceae bacterium]
MKGVKYLRDEERVIIPEEELEEIKVAETTRAKRIPELRKI